VEIESFHHEQKTGILKTFIRNKQLLGDLKLLSRINYWGDRKPGINNERDRMLLSWRDNLGDRKLLSRTNNW
jgi:hypothetical protein